MDFAKLKDVNPLFSEEDCKKLEKIKDNIKDLNDQINDLNEIKVKIEMKYIPNFEGRFINIENTWMFVNSQSLIERDDMLEFSLYGICFNYENSIYYDERYLELNYMDNIIKKFYSWELLKEYVDTIEILSEAQFRKEIKKSFTCMLNTFDETEFKIR